MENDRYRKPIDATEYQTDHYGYAVPYALGAWGWSDTFGKWGRSVQFVENGPWIFTWPKPF